MTNGEQCVITAGTGWMLWWFVSSWDFPMVEVSLSFSWVFISEYVEFSFVDGRAFRNAHFGAGIGPIFLDEVECTSNTRRLLECTSRPILSHNCLHSDDAGVACEGRPFSDVMHNNTGE